MNLIALQREFTTLPLMHRKAANSGMSIFLIVLTTENDREALQDESIVKIFENRFSPAKEEKVNGGDDNGIASDVVFDDKEISVDATQCS